MIAEQVHEHRVAGRRVQLEAPALQPEQIRAATVRERRALLRAATVRERFITYRSLRVAARFGGCLQLCDQPRLAHARFADERHHLSAALGDGGDRRLQPGQLLLPANQLGP